MMCRSAVKPNTMECLPWQLRVKQIIGRARSSTKCVMPHPQGTKWEKTSGHLAI
jgi:hypothetical protein